MVTTQEDAMVDRAFAHRILSRRPAERDSLDLVIDLTTPDGRAVCLAAEQRAREFDAVFACGRPPSPPEFICAKCGGAKSSPNGTPHAPHAGEGPPGYGPAWVDCVGDVIDPWPPVRPGPKGEAHGP